MDLPQPQLREAMTEPHPVLARVSAVPSPPDCVSCRPGGSGHGCRPARGRSYGTFSKEWVVGPGDAETAAAAAGIPERGIAKTAGHKETTMHGRYIREDTLFTLYAVARADL